jgi:hypothetical protein
MTITQFADVYYELLQEFNKKAQAHITTASLDERFKTGRSSDTHTYVNVVSDNLNEHEHEK